MKSLRTGDLIRLSGASLRQVDYWSHLDVFPPELMERASTGSGQYRLFRPITAPVTFVLVKLQADGVQIEARLLGAFARELVAARFEWWPEMLPVPGAPWIVVSVQDLRAMFTEEHPAFAAELATSRIEVPA